MATQCKDASTTAAARRRAPPTRNGKPQSLRHAHLFGRNGTPLNREPRFSRKIRKMTANEPPVCQHGAPFVSTAADLSARRAACHHGRRFVSTSPALSVRPPVCQHGGRFVRTTAGLSARPRLCQHGREFVSTAPRLSAPPLICLPSGRFAFPAARPPCGRRRASQSPIRRG